MRDYSIDSISNIPVRRTDNISALGNAITDQEVEDRLSSNLYKQLADGSDTAVSDAIKRAQIYVGAILRSFGQRLNLDDKVIREVVLLNTIYELHMALGHEEAGREYRTRAKDLVLVTWGDYKDTDAGTTPSAAGAAIATPHKRGRYDRALKLGAAR